MTALMSRRRSLLAAAALATALMSAAPGCTTPLAVGAVIVGGSGVTAGVLSARGCSGDDGCAMAGAAGALLALVSLPFLIGGTIYLVK